MRCFRLRPLLFLVLLLIGRASLAQQATVPTIAPHKVEELLSGHPLMPTVLPLLLPLKAPVAKPSLLFLLNTTIIVDVNALTFSKKDIKKLKVYTVHRCPRQWRSLAANGIGNFIVKASFAATMQSKTLAEIGQELKLTGPVSYTINGMLTTETALRIANEAIGEIKVNPATPEVPNALIAIQITKRERKMRPPIQTGIRGMVAR